MELLEALRTNPSVREFTDEAVPDDVVAAILDDARFAPSGGNRQPWRVAVVQDPALRRALADLCGPVWSEYLAIGATGATPFAVAGPQPSRRATSARSRTRCSTPSSRCRSCSSSPPTSPPSR